MYNVLDVLEKFWMFREILSYMEDVHCYCILPSQKNKSVK